MPGASAGGVISIAKLKAAAGRSRPLTPVLDREEARSDRTNGRVSIGTDESFGRASSRAVFNDAARDSAMTALEEARGGRRALDDDDDGIYARERIASGLRAELAELSG